MAQSELKKEIHTYEAPWMTYALAWSRRQDSKFRMAVGSFKEEYTNQIHIVQLNKETDSYQGEFEKLCEFNHPYPPTKLMFAPSSVNGAKDLLATTGDYLRLWNIDTESNHAEMKAILNNNKHTGIIF
jgi:WD repeat-containing protein 68